MKTSIILSAVLAVMITLTSPAYADVCSDRARQLAGSMNADVISVQMRVNANGKVTCIARMKVNSPGKPSRIITKKFNP